MTRTGFTLAEAYSRTRVHPHMQSERPITSQQSRVEKGLLVCELLDQLQRMGSVKKIGVLGLTWYQLLRQRFAA